MEIKTCDKILFLFGGMLIGAFVILTIILISSYQIPYTIQFKIHGYSKESALAVCNGKNLEKTAFCLNSFVRGIYNYTPTKDSEKLDFEKIIKEGNDCRGYTFIYQTLFSELGFKTKKIRVFVDKEKEVNYYHTWLIAYDENGYCSLDQKDINCFIYGK